MKKIPYFYSITQMSHQIICYVMYFQGITATLKILFLNFNVFFHFLSTKTFQSDIADMILIRKSSFRRFSDFETFFRSHFQAMFHLANVTINISITWDCRFSFNIIFNCIDYRLRPCFIFWISETACKNLFSQNIHSLHLLKYLLH